MRGCKARGGSLCVLAALAFAACLCCAGEAGAAAYVFSTFTGDTAAGEKLSIYVSSDALNFTLLSNTGFGGTSGTVRDPSIMKYSDGRYYVAYTNPPTVNCCGQTDHFSIASSADLVHWTPVTIVHVGVPNASRTWAPEWFLGDGDVKITANIDTLSATGGVRPSPSDFQPYVFTAQTSDLTSFGGPVPLGIAPDSIDTFVLKHNGTYHAFVKGVPYCEHATAPALTGPWTFVGKGDFAGWGPGMEGPAVVQIDDGTWRIFLDGHLVGRPLLTATSPDLYQWSGSTPVPVIGNLVHQGTVLRDVPFAGDGGSPIAADGGASPETGATNDDGASATSGDASETGDGSQPSAAPDGATGSPPAADATLVGDGFDGASPSGGPVSNGGGSGARSPAADAADGVVTNTTHGDGCSCRAAGRRGSLVGDSCAISLLAVVGGLRRRRSNDASRDGSRVRRGGGISK